jgi:hypothetical protein
LTKADIQNPFLQQMFDRVAGAAGATNGQLTRDQWIQGSEQLRASGGGGGPSGGQGQQPGGRNGGRMNFDPAAFAEMRFKQLDKNGDGFLSFDEMPDDLKAEKDKWDTDHNGLIDLTEYKAFVAARSEQMQSERQAAGFTRGQRNQQGGAPDAVPQDTPAAPAEDPKPVVYHADNLPANLPAWFSQLDTDRDGQVGLYEWKAAGRPIGEFLKMDRNSDGFLTVEEVLAYVADHPEAGGGNTPGGGGYAGAGFAGRGGGNGFQARPGGGGQGVRGRGGNGGAGGARRVRFNGGGGG